MGCCGKAKTKVKNIIEGYTNLARKRKCPDTDRRVRICQKCEKNYWIKKMLWCSICKCYIPAKARVENEKCPIEKW